MIDFVASRVALQDNWIFGLYNNWNASMWLEDVKLWNHVGSTPRYDYGQAPEYVETRSAARDKINKLLKQMVPTLDIAAANKHACDA